jgi:hypothetical protein
MDVISLVLRLWRIVILLLVTINHSSAIIPLSRLSDALQEVFSLRIYASMHQFSFPSQNVGLTIVMAQVLDPLKVR